MRRTLTAMAAALLLGACAAGPRPASLTAAPSGGEALALFRADDALEKDWQLFRVWRRADVGLAALDDRVAIRIAAEGASAGLGRWIAFDPTACPVIEWTWRVDSLPARADLTGTDSEDVAASVLVFFGDPGSLTLPSPVPTLRYVWATADTAPEAVVASPYLPTLRSLAVRSGPAGLGIAVTERRDLLADYAAAFGGRPAGPVELVALFTDSDHKGDPVEAYYLDARALCDAAPDPDAIL